MKTTTMLNNIIDQLLDEIDTIDRRHPYGPVRRAHKTGLRTALEKIEALRNLLPDKEKISAAEDIIRDIEDLRDKIAEYEHKYQSLEYDMNCKKRYAMADRYGVIKVDFGWIATGIKVLILKHTGKLGTLPKPEDVNERDKNEAGN